MLAWIDQWGSITVREAGRIVYRNRGQNPDRVTAEWKDAAGLRVLISLRRRGLVTERRSDNRWHRRRRTTTFNPKGEEHSWPQ